MARDWKEVKKIIHTEAERIWFEEPEYVTMSKLGVFPSGAGTDHQFFGNLFFLNADTQGMGWWTVEPAMYAFLSDEKYSLELCKDMFAVMTGPMAHLMGDVHLEGNCPAPWMNLGLLTSYYEMIIDSYDSIKTKEELYSLLWSWFCYMLRLNSWFYTVLPWELGKSMQRKDLADVEQLADFLGYKLIKK